MGFCRFCGSKLKLPLRNYYIWRRYFATGEKAKRNEILKRNRRDPKLEEAARKRQLFVPLDEVYSEWCRQMGPVHLQNVGEHFNLFADIYGTPPFLPLGFLGVAYEGHRVRRGNILCPAQVLRSPSIQLPMYETCSLRGRQWPQYWTLVMSNPDGNLLDNDTEILHWMIGNIVVGKDLSSGQELCPYLPPLPFQGTGVHRIVFSLYSHNERLSYPAIVTQDTNSWLHQRMFSSRQFLLSHSHLQLSPFTFCLYQTLWDESVQKIFNETLNFKEPVYEVEKLPTKRTARQIAIRQSRTQRYRDIISMY